MAYSKNSQTLICCLKYNCYTNYLTNLVLGMGDMAKIVDDDTILYIIKYLVIHTENSIPEKSKSIIILCE